MFLNDLNKTKPHFLKNKHTLSPSIPVICFLEWFKTTVTWVYDDSKKWMLNNIIYYV